MSKGFISHLGPITVHDEAEQSRNVPATSTSSPPLVHRLDPQLGWIQKRSKNTKNKIVVHEEVIVFAPTSKQKYANLRKINVRSLDF